MAMPIPLVQRTRKPADLLWRTRPDTPHGKLDQWKSKSPRMSAQTRSAFCDGPELCHRRSEFIYMIWLELDLCYKLLFLSCIPKAKVNQHLHWYLQYF
jgi:hypothetical protein